MQLDINKDENNIHYTLSVDMENMKHPPFELQEREIYM